MSNLTGTERTEYVQKMFARIARRYDLLNRLMTLGQDARWRKEAISRLEMQPNTIVLDLGSRTGDIAFEISQKYPNVLVIASDFTPEMIRVGRERPEGKGVQWVIADAQHLPFKATCASGVISGFLLRNVPDVNRTLAEHYRVLVDGGRAVSLDTSPPRKNLLRPFLEFHLHYVIPFLGKIIAGDAEAYTYLPDSTEGFLPADELAARFQDAGFKGVGFVRRMLGTVSEPAFLEIPS
jgi:demethylmenaquinone methyltransferase/2-methoxy-6-polyprenyl-1,4-benzoquinol methylase